MTSISLAVHNCIYRLEPSSGLRLESCQLGADPELFLADPTSYQIIPAFEVLPGKENPLLGGNGRFRPRLFHDGFPAEFTTPPQTCLDYFTLYIEAALITLADTRYKSKAVALKLTSTYPVSEEQLMSAPPQHIRLGCDPSFNVYGFKGEPVLDPRKLRVRFAGGHMHFGWPRREQASFGSRPLNWSQERCEERVKFLDKVVGVWAIAVAGELETPPLRREYYGLPGEYRIQPHGFEYRTLSNFWLAHSALTYLTWDIARMCVNVAGTEIAALWSASDEETVVAIARSDVALARAILQRNRELFIQLVTGSNESYLGSDRCGNAAYDLAMRGINSYGALHPSRLLHNWTDSARRHWSVICQSL